MSETINRLPLQAEEAQIPSIDPARELKLRRLLDEPYEPCNYGNFEYALSSGLIDEFYYDPETGADGLAHILTGELVSEEDGSISAGGFHHEPSGKYVSGNLPPSNVDRKHLEGANSAHKKEFREHAFEPYRAKVAIAGLSKTTGRRNQATGREELDEINNGMFPKEYDALAVMQAVRIAKKTRDKTQDRPGKDGRIVAYGSAPMVDNATSMTMRLILDPQVGS